MSGLDRLWAGWRSSYIESVTSAPGGRATSGESSGDSDSEAGCVFCAILASGEDDEATHVLWRHGSGLAVAILNAYPYCSGHLMVMPARHVASPELLDAAEAGALWEGTSSAVSAVRAAYKPDGLNLGANLGRAGGAGVPGHLHVHVLPRWDGDTNFMTSVADTRVLPEPLDVSAGKLRRSWPPAAGA
ncbi:MAG: HIT family protein [Acidimicrobiales bacterium]